jgi:hypothetical protein
MSKFKQGEMVYHRFLNYTPILIIDCLGDNRYLGRLYTMEEYDFHEFELMGGVEMKKIRDKQEKTKKEKGKSNNK